MIIEESAAYVVSVCHYMSTAHTGLFVRNVAIKGLNMEKLVILDYNRGTVDIYDVDSGANIDERYIDELGHNPDECSWMFKEDVTVKFNKEVLR